MSLAATTAKETDSLVTSVASHGQRRTHCAMPRNVFILPMTLKQELTKSIKEYVKGIITIQELDDIGQKLGFDEFQINSLIAELYPDDKEETD